MKCLSFKHSGSETKILPLGDTRARIGPKMQSPQLPSLLPDFELAIGPHPIATAVTKLWHLCTQLKSISKA
jgi:hypothetical protein